MLEQRRDALERLDHVRRLLVNEPRGHADMYGCHVVPGTTTAPTSASSSSTTPATRPPAATARSRSSPGRSTRASSSGARARTGSSSTCPRAGSRRRHVVEGAQGAVGHLPQRALVRLGDRRRASASARSTSPSAAPSTRRARGAGRAARAAAADRARAGAQARARGGARDRASARAGAARRLRRHLLAARGRRSVRAAERDRVCRRRGRPLAVRLGYLGPARAARRVRPAAARGDAPPSLDRRLRVRRHASSARTEVAGRPAVVTEVDRQRLPHG